MTESTKSRDAAKALIELFQHRYALRILWELRAGALTFRALQDACNATSPSTLNARLNDLRKANLIEHSAGEGYVLTRHGQGLLAATAALFDWATTWRSPAPKPRQIIHLKNRNPLTRKVTAKKSR